ncbi:hypothetical protein Tco_1452010 [Tanacetum coccineum]
MRRASKGYFKAVIPLFDTMLVQPQDEAPSTSPSRITSSPSLSSHHTPPSTLNTPPSFQTTHEAEETATTPHDSPLPGGHTLGSDEGRLKHDELMELVTKLLDKVVAVEEDLKQIKKIYSTAFTKLVLKVKKLEKQVRFGKARRRARIEKNSVDTEVLLEEETPTQLIEDLGSGEKGEKEISTAEVPVSTSGAEVSTASHDVNTAAAALVYHALQNRPYYVAKVRKNMVMYLKNQAGYKQSYFKGMKYEDIRPIFEKVWDQPHTFVPMDSEDKEKDSEKKEARRNHLQGKEQVKKQSEESTKRQKIEDDVEKEELKAYLD